VGLGDVPMAFMGSCFMGAMATSHAFFILSVSISSEVGAFRVDCLEDSARSFFVRDAVYPGGSGIDEFLGLDGGGELRSTTHCGGSGGCAGMTAFEILGDVYV
jgi:hypothetical protein